VSAQRRLKIQILVDSVLGVAFLLAFQPRFTGQAVHEWMGLGLGAVVLVHLLLGWKWMVSVGQKLLGGLPGRTRVLYAVNLALLAAFIGAGVTGVLVSKVVFAHAEGNRILMGLHKLFGNGLLVLMGLHLALNWQWVVNLWNKYLGASQGATRTAIYANSREAQ